MVMILEEHALIVEAIENKEPALESSHMDEHMKLLERRGAEEWRKYPEYFIKD